MKTNLPHADSFNLLVNNGEAAGQVIFHVSCNCSYSFIPLEKQHRFRL